MVIKIYLNNNAKNHIKKMYTQLLSDADNCMYIDQWLNEPGDVKCYEYNNDVVKNIILISKCDYDPLNIHSDPYILNYIYTFTNYRRKNIAYNMLLYLKNKEQLTVFCDSYKSEQLFEKAGFTISTNCYRYP